jgi:GNAT superfamily N-acetyltransferase
MTDVTIRQLTRGDRRDGFRSGQPDLDRFFQRYAGQNQFRHHIGTTYVAVADKAVVGYVTVSPGELSRADASSEVVARLPDYPLPVLRIARLAVDARAQGQGVGKALLRFALRLGVELKSRYGCVGVVVDAKRDAEPFYARLGFLPLAVERGGLGDRPEPTPMFLPIRQVVEAIEGRRRG